MSIVTPSKKSRVPLTRDDLDSLGLLLTPSWLSGLLTLVASLSLVFGTVALWHYHGSILQQFLTGQLSQPNSVGTNFTAFEHKLNDNAFISNLPLIIFWAGVGIIVYYLVVAIADAFRNVIELGQEMGYVHVNRRVLLGRAFFHLALRVAFLIAWMLYTQYTLRVLLPYIIALSSAGSGEAGWLYDNMYIIGAVLIATVCLHLHTVLLRLLVLRPRLFGDVIKI